MIYYSEEHEITEDDLWFEGSEVLLKSLKKQIVTNTDKTQTKKRKLSKSEEEGKNTEIKKSKIHFVDSLVKPDSFKGYDNLENLNSISYITCMVIRSK